MAQPKVGGLRTTGSRTVVEEAGAEADLSPQPINSQFKHVYQSRKSDFVISLKKRRVHFLADGSKEEEVPMTEAGNRLDMVRFTDNFFRTNDDEIDAAFGTMPPHVFGIEGLCWRFEEMQSRQRQARAQEIRAALASDPDLAKAVKLTPTDAKDWDVKPKGIVPPADPEDVSLAELERLTAPQPSK